MPFAHEQFSTRMSSASRHYQLLQEDLSFYNLWGWNYNKNMQEKGAHKSPFDFNQTS
jgi:hypothetical protein